jgi:molecular chaperone GrpE
MEKGEMKEEHRKEKSLETDGDVKTSLTEEGTPESSDVSDTELSGEVLSQEEVGQEARFAELEEQVSQHKDLFLRKAAEFENFKKRTESEISTLVKFANEDLVLSFLPVVDDIERALKSAKHTDDEASLQQGIELILQKIMKVLESNGVTPMETVGKEFDVDYHDVLLQIQKPDVPPHTIVEEVERGYLMQDRVIRHAKVIIAAGPDESHGHSHDEESADREPSPPSEAR